MNTYKRNRFALNLGVSAALVLIPSQALAQQAAQPAGEGALPEVQVIQKKATPAAKAAAKKAIPAKQAPAPAPDFVPDNIETSPPDGNSAYGAVNSKGAQERALNNATSPVNPVDILPGNLEQFSSAGSRVDKSQMDEFQP